MHKCHQNYSVIDQWFGIGKKTAKYNAKYALRGVSWSLKSNELLGLLGPNGAGKTTCMKLIVGDEAPFAGEVSTYIFSPL